MAARPAPRVSRGRGQPVVSVRLDRRRQRDIDKAIRAHNRAHPDDQLQSRADWMRAVIDLVLYPARDPDRRQLRH